jgi:hypothetical protein
MIPPPHSFFLYGLVLVRVLASSSVATASSFYDNPDQEPVPEHGTPLEELQRKWSTDVRSTPSPFSPPLSGPL